MIRANLLPRAKEVVKLFGFAIDADYVRQACMGIVFVVLVGIIGAGVEELRVRRLEAAATSREALLLARAPDRAAAKVLALEVARFQEFARQADTFRRSGSLAALAVVRIGNTVPANVWLESLDHDTDGYALSGASKSVDLLSSTMLSLSAALPQSSALLLEIDNHSDERDGVRFRAHVGLPDAGRVPVQTR